MPIYEYRCASCGYQKDFLQRLSDAPLADCPECGKRTFSKQVTAAGFQLKGTGWSATDFKNSGKKPAAKQDKSDAKQDKAETKQDKVETKQDKAETKRDKAEAKQDKAETKQDKPAESSSKESSKTEPSRGAGASPASN